MKALKDKVAVITGAACGIGRGMAERFLAAGMKLVLSDVDQPALEQAAAELKSAAAGKAEIFTMRTDVSVAAEVEALAKAAVERFGAVHVLCNNAGVGGWQRFETAGLPTLEWTLGVNLWGPIYGTHYFLPILAKQEEAHIVNTGSVACFVHSAYNIPYSITKAGLLALTHGLYQECKKHHPNIGVTLLCPGTVATEMAANDERNAPAGHVRRSVADPEVVAFREQTRRHMPPGMAPSVVGDMVVEAIRTGQFYVHTHPEFMGMIRGALEPIYTSPVPNDFNAMSERR